MLGGWELVPFVISLNDLGMMKNNNLFCYHRNIQMPHYH